VLALKGADVIILPHAPRIGWGEELTEEKQIEKLTGKLESLPGENGVLASDNIVFAVYASQAGYNGHSTHIGGAYVLGPDGKLITRSEPVLDDLWVSAEIDPAVQEKLRGGTHSTLKMRRPELYGEITDMR
jgi:predicted amidohydrolase